MHTTRKDGIQMKRRGMVLPVVLAVCGGVVAVSFPGVAGAASAEKTEWPFVTMRLSGSNLNVPEKTRRFVEVNVARPGSCDAYWFCGADGDLAMPEVERRLGIIAPLRAVCEKAGIEFSYQQGWTLGHYSQPYKPPVKAQDPAVKVIRSDGSYARNLRGEKIECYCPRSPDVLSREEELVERLVRTGRFRAIWIDDDCRLHKEPNWACFCDRCLAAFNREEGLDVTRAELARRLFEGEEVDGIRGKWVNFNARSLALFGAAARRGADKADPTVRLCLQNVTPTRYWSGLDYRPILWELSGHGRVKTAVRAGSGFFCGEIVRMLASKLYGVMKQSEQVKACGDWVASCTYENETCPREVMQKSSEAVMIENALALAAGCDALSLYWWDASRDEPLEYYEELADDVVAWRPYFKRLADLAKRTHAGGAAWDRPADFYNRRQGPPKYTDGAQAFCDGNTWTNYWLMISGVPMAPVEGRPAARFTQADVSKRMRLGKNVSPTTAEIESFRDRLDELSGGKMPVRPAKTHRLVVLPRVGEKGELRAVTVWNVSIGAMRQMPLRLRNPAATRFVWARGAGAPDVTLQGVSGTRSGEWVVTLPDLNGYGVGTLFCE